jgi:NADH-quinone oxidoreductase subunit L
MFTLVAVFAPLLGAILAGVARPFIGKNLPPALR